MKSSLSRYYCTSGSFGHFQAKKYALKNGRDSQDGDTTQASPSWRKGLSLTRQSVQKLNMEVLAAHVAAGLPAVTVSPFPTAITGRVAHSPESSINPYGSVVKQSGALSQLLALAEAGLVPIIHGDIVIDDSQTCAVLGGDHIISWYETVISTTALVKDYYEDTASRFVSFSGCVAKSAMTAKAGSLFEWSSSQTWRACTPRRRIFPERHWSPA